jgi:phasin
MATNFPNQQPSVTDLPHVLRDATEKGVTDAKETFEKMSAAAADATEQMKNVYTASFKGIQDYSAKVFEFAHLNMTAAIEHAKKLATAKTPTEYFELTNEYMRTHMETLTKQAQELAAIAQKMTAPAMESLKARLNKSS